MEQKSWLHRVKRTALLILILLLLFLALAFIPTGYDIMYPGEVSDLSQVIEVENGYYNQNGIVYMTMVPTGPASVLDLLYQKIATPEGVELIPSREQIPEDMDRSEFFQLMLEIMEESTLHAQALAFERAGIEYSRQAEGVRVGGVIPEGKAEGYIETGDILVGINGHQVEFATEAVQLIQDREIGDEVEIHVRRNDSEKKFMIETVEMEQNPGVPSIGVYIGTINPEFDFEREVFFDTGQIGGSSAGVMFVLEIYNQLTEEDITKGKKIAGTGTINLEGEVNRIGGARQKAIGAEKAGVEIFFVPEKNLTEAQRGSDDLEIVPINHIDDLFAYLENL